MSGREEAPTSSDQTEISLAQGEGRTEEPRHHLSESTEELSTSHESGRDHDIASPLETQSSIVSDITLRSRTRLAVGGSIESDVHTSVEERQSSGSLTFHPPSSERAAGDTALSEHYVWPPSSPPRQRVSSEEIKEAASDDDEAAEVSIASSIPSHPPSSRFKRKGRLRLNLKKCSGNLSKRLCYCLSPTAAQAETSSQDDDFKIKSLDLDEGILHSKAEMNSFTAHQVEEVILEHGEGLAVLADEKYLEYEDRMNAMLDTYFEMKRGFEVLRLWKMEKARPLGFEVEALPSSEFLPSSSSEERILTLEDIRLHPLPSDDRFMLADDSLFRYFMSSEGLNGRMLVSGHG